jgi:hypothetical protein
VQPTTYPRLRIVEVTESPARVRALTWLVCGGAVLVAAIIAFFALLFVLYG